MLMSRLMTECEDRAILKQNSQFLFCIYFSCKNHFCIKALHIQQDFPCTTMGRDEKYYKSAQQRSLTPVPESKFYSRVICGHWAVSDLAWCNNLHANVPSFQLRCPVYAYFVAKMSKITITRFGGQVQLENTTVGRLDDYRTGSSGMPCLDHTLSRTGFSFSKLVFFTILTSGHLE